MAVGMPGIQQSEMGLFPLYSSVGFLAHFRHHLHSIKSHLKRQNKKKIQTNFLVHFRPRN